MQPNNNGDIEEGLHHLAPVQEEEEDRNASSHSMDLSDLIDWNPPPHQEEEGKRGNEIMPASEGSEYSESVSFEELSPKDSKTTEPDEESHHVQFSAPVASKENFDRGMTRSKGRSAINEAKVRLSTKGQHVQIRHGSTQHAMDYGARRRNQWKKTLSKLLKKDGSDSEEEVKISMHGRLMVQPSRRILTQPAGDASSNDGEDDEDEEEKRREETQYRLTAIKRKRGRRNQMAIPGMYEDLLTSQATECCCCCPCPNMNSDRVMSAFLHWSFRSSFVVVFGSAALGWFALTLGFAFLIYILGKVDPFCIGGVDFNTTRSPFADAYQLSWSTFATVGYGLIYPATSANYPDVRKCTVITILTTFESFVGVLFASLCAALMFAKVARVQSFAQVTFSDPIVIRYGTGVFSEEGHEDDDDDDEEVGGKKEKVLGSKIPCPVLEFRIFNRLSDLPGGEIIDATLNMVASIDVSQADPALATRNQRRKKGKKKRNVKARKSFSLRFQKSQRSQTSIDKAKSEEIADSAGDKLSEVPTKPEEAKGSKPDIALRQQSIAERDAPIPLNGPAPAMKQWTTPIESNRAKPDQVLRHRSQADNDTPQPLKEPASALQQATKPFGRRQTAVQVQNKPMRSQQDQDKRPETRQSIWGNSSLGSIGQAYTYYNGSGQSGGPLMPTFGGRRRKRQDSVGRRQRMDSGLTRFFMQQNLRQVSSRMPVNQQFEEDPTGRIIPKKILSKLEIESPDHPFFSRIWLVRHTLDANSLLLKPHVRAMLERNQGFWPPELNNYESVRASIEFDQILVSLTGTSNADANSVYAQHVYHMFDVNVGYRFVNALYRDPNDGALRVDQNLLNDVMEQAGGGGEPLNDFERERFHDILVL